MKKTFLLLIILAATIGNSQSLPQTLPMLPKDWQRIYIKDIGSFDLPPTMEIQKGKFREFIDNMKKIHGFDVTQITAQQKGLNEFQKSSAEKYARVMLNTTFGKKGDFEKLNFNINEFTQTDINDLNLSYKKKTQKEFSESAGVLKLVEWYPVTVEKVNGMSCIHICYKRQAQNNPPALVNMYLFPNDDRMYTLTLSYRISEGDYWKSDFITILKSFRITDIR